MRLLSILLLGLGALPLFAQAQSTGINGGFVPSGTFTNMAAGVVTSTGSVLQSTNFPSVALTGGYQINSLNAIKFPNGENQSVAIGNLAGASITSAYDNVFIGYMAGSGATTCASGSAGTGYDVAVGWQSLVVDNGCENTGVGANTLLQNTTGSFNVMVGNDAGSWISTGNNNIGMGHSACGGGASPGTFLTGNSNTCIGDNTGGYLNGTAASNVFIGAISGQGTNTNKNTASNNTAVGWGTLQFVSTSTNNVAIGFAAMEGSAAAPLTGAANTAVGSNALQVAQGSGVHNNTAVGYQVLAALTSGNYDTCIGNQSCGAMTNDYFTTVLGSFGGQALNGGYSNTLIGYAVASATLTTGTNNVIITSGGSSCDTAASGTSNTIGICAGSTAVWSATGTGTPSTSATSIAGTLALPAITTGTNVDFVCMKSGLIFVIQASSCTISSNRFKEDINPFTGDALSELNQLEVRSYRMKEKNRDPNGDREQIGIIAESVAKVEPKCAIYEDDLKTPKSYRPECITALLVAAAQEHVNDTRRQFELIYALMAGLALLTLHAGHLHLKVRRLSL